MGLIYQGFAILKEGGKYTCPDLGICGTLPEVKKAIYEIQAEGWTSADIELLPSLHSYTEGHSGEGSRTESTGTGEASSKEQT